MHVILCSTVTVHVLLNCCAPSCVLTSSTVIIVSFLTETNHFVEDFVSNWVPNIEFHCSNYSITEIIKPGGVEISDSTRIKSATEEEALPLEISSAKHKQEACVEELARKYDFSDLSHLLRFIIMTYFFNNFDDYHSNSCIQENNCVFN